jgi:carbon-monoxide dehydrogenase medium subunit
VLNVSEIYKPTTLADALKYLQQPGTAALSGGTELISGQRLDVNAVVDLSGLGLSYVRESSGAIAIGAMTTLAELTESPILRAIAGGVIARAAHRSATNVLRNQGTIAGTLIVEPDSVIPVALLALDAQATVVRKDPRTVPLADFLPMRDHLLMMALLTEINIPLTNPRASLQSVERTPADKPIVSVCAAAHVDKGILHNVRVALGGVGETALRASASEMSLEGQVLDPAIIENAAAMAPQGLSAQSDTRGSAEYRKEMATVLTRRALNELTA